MAEHALLIFILPSSSPSSSSSSSSSSLSPPPPSSLSTIMTLSSFSPSASFWLVDVSSSSPVITVHNHDTVFVFSLCFILVGGRVLLLTNLSSLGLFLLAIIEVNHFVHRCLLQGFKVLNSFEVQTLLQSVYRELHVLLHSAHKLHPLII